MKREKGDLARGEYKWNTSDLKVGTQDRKEPIERHSDRMPERDLEPTGTKNYENATMKRITLHANLKIKT